MGLLVLPVTAKSLKLPALRCHGQAADTMVQRWFDAAEDHDAVLQQLHRLGWELPRNNDGAHAWYHAGRSQCCGRTIISLTSVDVEDVTLPVQQLMDSTQLMLVSAAETCQSAGHR
jgi:hypothetical protein